MNKIYSVILLAWTLSVEQNQTLKWVLSAFRFCLNDGIHDALSSADLCVFQFTKTNRIILYYYRCLMRIRCALDTRFVQLNLRKNTKRGNDKNSHQWYINWNKVLRGGRVQWNFHNFKETKANFFSFSSSLNLCKCIHYLFMQCLQYVITQ